MPKTLYADACAAFPALSVHELGGVVSVHSVAVAARTPHGLRVIAFDRESAHWLASKGIAPGWGASDVERVKRGALDVWAFHAVNVA